MARSNRRCLAGELLGSTAQKVWSANVRCARHPNVVVLDLSSFKAGNDAPTYGLIDSDHWGQRDAALGAARHRCQQAGRLDQDSRQDSMPTALPHEERLEDVAKKKNELQLKIEEKRLQLLQPKQKQLEERKQQDECWRGRLVHSVAEYAVRFAPTARRRWS